MELPAYSDLGTTAYASWTQLDKSAQKWADRMFNNAHRTSEPVEAYTYHDGLSLNIELKNLRDNKIDRNTIVDIFTTYDKEKECNPYQEFQFGEDATILTSLMSLRIFQEILPQTTNIGFKPKALIANEYGVIFCEKVPDCLADYYTVEKN